VTYKPGDTVPKTGEVQYTQHKDAKDKVVIDWPGNKSDMT
jgi:hypothetical protein